MLTVVSSSATVLTAGAAAAAIAIRVAAAVIGAADMSAATVAAFAVPVPNNSVTDVAEAALAAPTLPAAATIHCHLARSSRLRVRHRRSR
jgi:hypothetical protein